MGNAGQVPGCFWWVCMDRILIILESPHLTEVTLTGLSARHKEIWSGKRITRQAKRCRSSFTKQLFRASSISPDSKRIRFYLYQSKWRPDLPMAHILPHWTGRKEKIRLLPRPHVILQAMKQNYSWTGNRSVKRERSVWIQASMGRCSIPARRTQGNSV